ncbi:helix-turn-helix domain-containing protein [Companilactobacillus baiquanensis]|uniref:Helix-turn-helix domain-containing protein n=1 Tax=Companilactobacillus baiquanensis TaxID=2486005 RepID=A0ABW1UR31_9LACO|nr:helix-turn-helix transcriptional regulator [Companilactobacillus baiquanensis]
MDNLGKTLKEKRIALHLSQKKACENICSQPMLSSIEQGKYIPNSHILILLCKRLRINIDQLSLSSNYQISSLNSFNQKLEKLCNDHNYIELKKFLLSDDTIAQVKASQQKAYYYYLSIAYLQADNDLDEFEYNLNLAMSEHPHSIALTTLDRLIFISMAVLYAKRKNSKYLDYLNNAFIKFNEVHFEDNQIILFYLAAYANILMGKNIDALNWINQGIDFATKNNSHYMLANLYYLFAKVLIAENKGDLALDSQTRSKIFTDLFNEKIFEFN